MKRKQLASFGSALVLSLSSLLILGAPSVSAAADTCTWTGAVNSNLNNAGNWTGCDNGTLPESGDSLDFPLGAGVTNKTLSNDFPANTSFATITFDGTAALSEDGYDITGNSIQLTSGFVASQNGQTSTIDVDITAASSLSITGGSTVNIGLYGTAKTFMLGSNTLTVSGSLTSPAISSKLVGSGPINSASYLVLYGDNSGYAGVVTQSARYLYLSNKKALGTGSAVINDGAELDATLCDGESLPNNLTFNGQSSNPSGDYATPKLTASFSTCVSDGSGSGGSSSTYDEYFTTSPMTTEGVITFSGALTLGADTTVRTYAKTLNITGAISGGHALKLLDGGGGNLIINSASNGSTSPNGTYALQPLTKTVSDDQAASSVLISGNYILILNGKRGNVTVEDGGTLKGTGTAGTVTVNNGGKVAPGLSPGCLSTGNLTFVSGSTYDFEVGGQTACTEYDQMKVTGTVDLGNGTLNTTLYNGFKPVAGQSYTIISNDGSDAVTGTFNNLAEGATFTVNGYVLKVTYKGGDGNDVVLSVQSVPTTPNTGFSLISSHPLQVFLLTTCLAGVLSLMAKRYNSLLSK